MSLSGIAKFFIGFLLGIALLVGAGAAAAYYFWTKLSVEPSKPIFAEERAKASPVSPVAKKMSSPTVKSPKPPTLAKAPSKELPPGAYKARVSWAEGLILRDAPGADANRTGGVAFNQDVFVLKESDDQRWQKIRAADSELEGWIKAGNTQRVN